VRTTTQEALWVLRAQSGDREPLEHLLRGVQPALRRYLLGLVGPSDADDVLQEVLIIVARKLDGLEDPQLFRPWAFRIATRAAWRYLKRHRRVEPQADESALDEIPARESQPSGELLEELLTAEALSPASRAVLVLHFKEEMSLPEIAAVLEIPLGTVKSRLAYGLSALRTELGNKRRPYVRRN
jgi:RNA polymerase sigma-70 factor (ECF subfamily)